MYFCRISLNLHWCPNLCDWRHAGAGAVQQGRAGPASAWSSAGLLPHLLALKHHAIGNVFSPGFHRRTLVFYLIV